VKIDQYLAKICTKCNSLLFLAHLVIVFIWPSSLI